MPLTDLDVCNMAIRRVGGEPIDAIDEDTPAGAYCVVEYPQARAWLLSKYRWDFANKIASLNRRVTTPVTCPRAYAFDRPADLVGAVHAYRTAADPRVGARVSAVTNEDYIAADQQVVFAEYTRAVPESLWPAWFTELVKTVFASGVAGALAQSQSLAVALRGEAFGPPSENGEGGLYGIARNEDSRNAPQREAFQPWDDGPLVNARYGDGWTGWSSPFVIPPGIAGPITFIDF